MSDSLYEMATGDVGAPARYYVPGLRYYGRLYPWVRTYRYTTRDALWDDVTAAVLDRLVTPERVQGSELLSEVTCEVDELMEVVIKWLNVQRTQKLAAHGNIPLKYAARLIARCCDVKTLRLIDDAPVADALLVQYSPWGSHGIYGGIPQSDMYLYDAMCSRKSLRGGFRLDEYVKEAAIGNSVVLTEDPTRLILGNGIWDLSTQSLLSFTPDYVSVYKPSVGIPEVTPEEPRYRLAGGTEMTVTELFTEWTRGTATTAEDIYRAIAAALHPTYSFGKAVLVKGRPRNKDVEPGAALDYDNCPAARFFSILKALWAGQYESCRLEVMYYDYGPGSLMGRALYTAENYFKDLDIDDWSIIKRIVDHEPVETLRRKRYLGKRSFRPHLLLVTDEYQAEKLAATGREIDFFTVSFGSSVDPSLYDSNIEKWLTSKEVLTWIVSHVLREVVGGQDPSTWLSS